MDSKISDYSNTQYSTWDKADKMGKLAALKPLREKIKEVKNKYGFKQAFPHEGLTKNDIFETGLDCPVLTTGFLNPSKGRYWFFGLCYDEKSSSFVVITDNRPRKDLGQLDSFERLLSLATAEFDKWSKRLTKLPVGKSSSKPPVLTRAVLEKKLTSAGITVVGGKVSIDDLDKVFAILS
jgi:hypothetical protein